MNNEMQKAIIYCRVSDMKQVRDGHGLESQETRCREFAVNKGYEVVAVYHERGVTGKLMDRPQMLAMLEYLQKHKKRERFIVIIDDISRLARDVETHIQLRKAVSNTGALLESPSIEFGDDSDSRFIELLLANVAGHQREKNAEQTRNRMRARAMNGYWVSRAPIGYEYTELPEHGKIMVPCEPLASIVKEGLEGYASGRFASQTELKRFFEGFSVFPRTPQGRVNFQTVSDMLKKSLYAARINLPNWGLHDIPAKHQPLISYETYQAIQNQVKGHSHAPARKDLHKDFPLRGFVGCACCEKPMTAGWTKGRSQYYPYYFCQQKGCEMYGKVIAKAKIEGDFEKLLGALHPTKSVANLAYDIFKDQWKLREVRYQEEADALKKEMADLDKVIAQTLDKIFCSDSPTLVKAGENRIKDLERDKQVLVEKIAKCGTRLPDFDDIYRTAFEFLANPRKLWSSERFADKRTVAKLAFNGLIPYVRNEGYRTAPIAEPFRLLRRIDGHDNEMVAPPGLEPGT